MEKNENNEKKNRRRIPVFASSEFFSSSRWPIEDYGYFIHVYEDIDYDFEPDGPCDEPLCLDPFEIALIGCHQDIASIPFDQGRGDKLREIIKNPRYEFSGFTIKNQKSFMPVNINLLTKFSLIRHVR